MIERQDAGIAPYLEIIISKEDETAGKTSEVLRMTEFDGAWIPTLHNFSWQNIGGTERDIGPELYDYKAILRNTGRLWP